MPFDATKPAPTRPTAHTIAYARDRRAELVMLLASAAKARKRGLYPIERACLPTLRETLGRLNRFSSVVLP